MWARTSNVWKLLSLWISRESVFESPVQKIFFSVRFFFTDTDDSQDSSGREETIFCSTLPLPPTPEHWEIYLQICMSYDYHVFLIAALVFTRLLLDEIYHLIELPISLIDWWYNVCFFTWWMIQGFCYSNLIWETGEFELASTITIILRPNPLTKCTSHPQDFQS